MKSASSSGAGSRSRMSSRDGSASVAVGVCACAGSVGTAIGSARTNAMSAVAGIVDLVTGGASENRIREVTNMSRTLDRWESRDRTAGA